MPRKRGKVVVKSGAPQASADVQAEAAPVKRGVRMKWNAPTRALARISAPEGCKARWVADHNVDRRLDEGYTVINRTTAPGAEHVDRGYVNGAQRGDGMGTALRYRELVAMAAPNEVIEQRNKFYEDKTRRMTEATINASALKTGAMKEIAERSGFSTTLTID